MVTAFAKRTLTVAATALVAGAISVFAAKVSAKVLAAIAFFALVVVAGFDNAEAGAYHTIIFPKLCCLLVNMFFVTATVNIATAIVALFTGGGNSIVGALIDAAVSAANSSALAVAMVALEAIFLVVIEGHAFANDVITTAFITAQNALGVICAAPTGVLNAWNRARAAWNGARNAIEPAWNRAVAALRGAVASVCAVLFASMGHVVLAVLVSHGKVSKTVACAPATAMLALAALVGASNAGLRTQVRTQMDTRGDVHFWFSGVLLVFAAAIFSDKLLDFALSSSPLLRIASRFHNATLAGAVLAETVERAWFQADDSAIKLTLRGNDEEAPAGGDDNVCVVCHVNKAVVASACCFKKTTCLSCS